MQVRELVVALIAGLNGLVEKLEEALAADDGGEAEENKKPQRRSRKSKDEDEDADEDEGKKSKRSSKKTKKKKDEDDDSEDEDEDEDDGDEPSEDDIIDAVRAAQKVLEKDDVVGVLRKYGKCDRASEVPADRRQKVIDALEKMVDEVA